MDNCKYNYKCNCECNFDKYEEGFKPFNGLNKCRKIEDLAEGLTKEVAELDEIYKEKIEDIKCVENEIKDLEKRLACLKDKERALCNEAMEIGEKLDKVTLEAFKHLFATIECYRRYIHHNERPERPERPDRPGCGCNYCCKDR